MHQPSERIKTVLALGGVEALFPVLKDWPTEELRALIDDAGSFYEASIAAIDTAWQKTAFEPGNFFNRENAQFLDRLAHEKQIEALAVTSEICSVAIFYLEERGIMVDPEET
jgi:hypothetical protein